MPSVTLHLLLAERVMDVWRARSHDAPFAPDDPDAVNAFRQGAFAPDLGYFPGGWRPLSDLAHCHRSADLARCLVTRARTPRERAFSWGWVTHVLADRAVHPLVGNAVGEVLHGRADRFVDGDQHPVAHVRVEAGLDAWYAQRHPRLRLEPLQPVFDEGSVQFLLEAFQQVYRVALDRRVLLHSHASAARRAGQGLRLAGWVADSMEAAATRASRCEGVRGPLARLREALARRSVVLGYLLPVAPAPWLVEAVDEVVTSFSDRFLTVYHDGLAGLPNVNLDTGRPDWLESTHGGTRRAFAALESLGPAPLLPGAAGRA